jgi:hypothetical protein
VAELDNEETLQLRTKLTEASQQRRGVRWRDATDGRLDMIEQVVVADLIHKAAKHSAEIQQQGLSEAAMLKYVTKAAEAADICFAVWSDPDLPEGIGLIAIKGRPLVDDLQTGVARVKSDRIDAVPCTSIDQAVVIFQSLN